MRFRHPHRAFTLVELLVAMSVLTILLLALTGITTSTQQVIQIEKGKLDSQEASSELLEQIEQDLQGRVTVPNAQFYWNKKNGNDEIAFYTRRGGYSGDRDASWVHYRLNGQNIERGTSGASYTGESVRTFCPASPDHWSDFAQIPGANYQSLGSQVLRTEISALVADSTGAILVKSGPPRNADATINTRNVPTKSGDPNILRGVIVTTVAVDSRDLKLLNDQQRTAIAAQFPDAADGVQTGSTWSPIAAQAGTLATSASIPAIVASHVRVYERVYPIQQ